MPKLERAGKKNKEINKDQIHSKLTIFKGTIFDFAASFAPPQSKLHVFMGNFSHWFASLLTLTYKLLQNYFWALQKTN